jgi:hypothetical protein
MSDYQQQPTSEVTEPAKHCATEPQNQAQVDHGAAIVALLEKPLLLSGEDPHAYLSLQKAVEAEVQPADFIEKIWITDVVYNQWETVRYRRFKTELVKVAKQEALEAVLRELMSYGAYELHSTVAEMMAWKYVMGDEEAMEEVGELLRKAQLTEDTIFARGVANMIEAIERFDRLIASSEARRDLILDQIYKRRALLGVKLRNAIKQIESAEHSASEIATERKEAA